MSLESVLERNIHTAYLGLDRSPIPEKGKELIRQYIADMKVEKEIGKHREYHYLVRLRESAERLGDRFVSPTKDDLKKMIAPLVFPVMPQKNQASPLSLSGCASCHSLNQAMDFPTTLTFLNPVFPSTESIAPYLSNLTCLFFNVRSSPILQPESYIAPNRALSR